MFEDKDEIYTFLKTICLPFVLTAASILLLRRTTTSKKQQAAASIPGNLRGKYPLLGDTLQLLNPKTMASYQVQSRHTHGAIWRTSVLFNKCVFVSGAKHLHQLSKQEQLHRNGTNACFPPHHRGLFGHHSVLVTSGEEHARLRGLITPALQPSLYQEEIDMAVTAFLTRCKTNSARGGYFPLVDEFKQFTLSVALRIVLGEERWQEWMKSDDSNSRLVALLDDFAIWSKGLLSPPTSFIPFTASYYAMKARKRIHDVLLEVIEEEKDVMHLQDGSSGNRNQKRCLIERLMRATTNDNAAVSTSLTEEAIIDNIFTLVFAGTDTTASVLTSAFFELAKNDELRKRLQACLETGASSDKNDDADEVLRAFLSEVQRCYPAAPFTMRNISGRGIDLGDDYGFVPPGFNITYAIAGTLLGDEVSYPNPSKFDMDRWLKKPGSKPLHNWAFGGGCRTCPGRFLSVTESVALLRAVLGRKDGFHWTLKDDQDLTFLYTPGYFPRDGLMVKIHSNI